MRSIRKTLCVLALAFGTVIMSGCCANCCDKWQYNECDLIEGGQPANCPGPCCDNQNGCR